MNVDINILGVLAGAAAAMVVGAIWYSKALFGNSWMKLVGLTEKKAKEGSIKAMVGTVFTTVIMAFVLAHVIGLSVFFYADYGYLQASITSALWMWLGFQFTQINMMGLFEQKSKKLIMINEFGQLASILAMGITIGLIGQ